MIFNFNNHLNEINIIKNDAIKFAESNCNDKGMLFVSFENDGILLSEPITNIFEGNSHNIDTFDLEYIANNMNKFNINMRNRRFILITENHTGHGARMKISKKGEQVTTDRKSYYEIFIKKEINHNNLEYKKSVDDYIDITDGVEVIWCYNGDNKIIKTNELDLYKNLYVSNLNLLKLSVECQKNNYPFDIEEVINLAFVKDSNNRYLYKRRVARFINGDVIIFKENTKNRVITDKDIDYKYYGFEDILRRRY